MTPIYPKNPKYYLFVFSSPFKQPIRITNSISFDYADTSYHLLTLSSPSYGLSANTFSSPSKSPQKSIPTSFLPENQYPFLITQYDGSGAYGGSGGKYSATSAIPPYAGFTNFHTASDHYGNVITHTLNNDTLL